MTTRQNRSRRGVGGIIAGVILIGILVTSVLAYFVTIANNDKARTGYELTALEEDRKKATEVYSVANVPNGGSLDVTVENNGPIPIRASQMILYCTSCINPDLPAASPVALGVTLNPGSSTVNSIGPVSSGSDYRVDVISERGNIVSSPVCVLDGSACDDGDGGQTEEEVEGKVNEGIIQGTGSIQLDFKAFGVIFPDLGTRGGVPQKGWEVNTGSQYGNATGYPGFDIPYQLNVIYVEKFRNLDPSEEAIILHRDTSLLTNIGKEQSQQPDIEFICAVNNKQTVAYNENNPSTRVVLPAIPANSSRSVGWQEIYFCSKTPGEADNDYQPTNAFNTFHPLFMVARGHFNETLGGYAQTIPYQSSSVGSLSASSFNACLRPFAFVSSTSCPNPDANDNNPLQLKYSATQLEMRLGTTVRLHVNQVTTDISVTWIYPDGTHKLLVDSQPLDSNKNILVTLPTTNSDGTAISCSDGIGSSEYYTLKVSDEFDSQGRKNVYYMTWQMNACLLP